MMPANPAVIEFLNLLQDPQNILVEQASSEGRIPIGYTCSFVPEALLMADRLFPCACMQQVWREPNSPTTTSRA